MEGIAKWNLSDDDIRSVIEYIIEREHGCKEIMCNDCDDYTKSGVCMR